MDVNQILTGDDLMLFDSDKKSIAFATSHTISLNTEFVEVSSKTTGLYNDSLVNKLEWEITSDNLFSEVEFERLLEIWQSGETMDIYFGPKDTIQIFLIGEAITDPRGRSYYWSKNRTDDEIYYESGYATSNDSEIVLTPAGNFGGSYSLTSEMFSRWYYNNYGNSKYLFTTEFLSELPQGEAIDSPSDAWSPVPTKLWGGKAKIANITVNAASGDNATYSIVLKGTGIFTKI